MRRTAPLWVIFFLFLVPAMGHAQAIFPHFFGVQDDKMTWDPSLRPKAPDVGAKWVRQYLFWSDVEPNPPFGPPNYNWSFYDSLFSEYSSLGLAVVIVIGGIPSWAAPAPYGPFFPGRMEDFKRFIGDLIERYDGDGNNDAPGSPVVDLIEFFNEPDLNSTIYAWAGWGYWGPSGSGGDGVDYAQMLQQVYPQVKASNPDVLVLLGGLAMEDNGFFNMSFLDEVLGAGGGNYFDIMNFHYYTAFESVWSSYGKDILGKVNYVRNVLGKYAFQQKPFFVTEAGEWSSTQCGKSEDIQARYVPKLYVRALSDGDIKGVAWFILQDFDYGPGWECDSTRGLFRIDGSPKPAYDAFKTVSDLLSTASFQEMLTNTQGYEGYRFLDSEGQSIDVLWNESGNLRISLTISSSQVIKTDKLGNQETIYPASGNQYDLTLGPDPIYLTFAQTIAETITTPAVPTGTANGETAIAYTYSTGASNSNLDHPVQYRFDWGDGTLSDWLAAGVTSATKSWPLPGVYEAKSQARCSTDTSVTSGWSSGLTVTISVPSESVSIPSIPGGLSSGSTGISYNYSTGGSSSSLGHTIQYFFDWGDGTNSGWLGVGTVDTLKSWPSVGAYSVKAKAQCASDLVESDWSDPLNVTVSGIGPDLTGEWISISPSCKNGKCKLSGTLKVENIGNKDASSTSVKIYLSENDTFNADDIPLKVLSTGKVKAGGFKLIKLKANLLTGETASGKHIIAVINEGNLVQEIDETNNVAPFGPIP